MVPYQNRPIRFLEVFNHNDWKIKLYSISVKNEFVEPEWVEKAKNNLDNWLQFAQNDAIENYKIATLILHEGREGCFAILSLWVEENMLQLFAWLAGHEDRIFKLCSDKGLVSCVWEMEVLWHERNVWVENVLKRAADADFEGYLAAQLNNGEVRDYRL